MRALLVDDEEDMRALARLRMELAGVDVVAEAADARAGIGLWLDQRPDVVVLDHRMPGTTGLDAAAFIHSIDPAARIVLFSAYLDDDGLRRAEADGITCVPKDRLDDLVRAVAADG